MGVVCHSLLQGIFLSQGWNPSLLHCRQILYHLNHLAGIQTHVFRPHIGFFWFTLFHLIVLTKEKFHFIHSFSSNQELSYGNTQPLPYRRFLPGLVVQT